MAVYLWQCLLVVLVVLSGSIGAVAEKITPIVVTAPVGDDSDDPAIWVHSKNPLKSLILGTDKGGRLFVYDLDGKVVATREGMVRLNNVDVEYGVKLGDTLVDIAVVTDRGAEKVYIFRLPDLVLLDGGEGIRVFEGETERRVMGIGLYKRPKDGKTFVVLSRKSGPKDGYLWQYQLTEKDGYFDLQKVRVFGQWSGKAEIEAIAVDDELGYVYYSDETFGVRKYYADPDVANSEQEVSVFGLTDFADDREGISIFAGENGKGYILVSDQQADIFRVFSRTDDHIFLGTVMLSTKGSDGSDVVSVALGVKFPAGLFVAMSEERTFHLYDWREIESALAKHKKK